MAKTKAKEKAKVEFVPLSPADQSEEQRKKVVEIVNEWTDGAVIKNWHGYWREYIYWFWGDQYMFYNVETGQLVDLSDIIEREYKNVYNRILPMIRQMYGEIRYPHSFYVEPNTTEPEDIKSAKLSSAVVEYLNIKGDFKNKINQAKFRNLITGNIYWKVWWNKNLSAYIKGEKGKAQGEKGDVDFNYISCFNVRPDPLAKNPSEWRWFDEGKELPASSVEAEFGLPAKTLPHEAIRTTDMDVFDVEPEKSKEPTVIRIEHWEKKSKARPKGRFMVVTSSHWLLWDKNSPAPDGELPYFKLPGIMPILNSQFDDSPVRIAQPSQRKLNRYGSMVDEAIEEYRVKCMVPGGSMSESDFKRYTRAGIDFVEFQPGVGAPYWQAPPPLPDFLVNWLDFQQNEIEEETSLRKISKAQIPKYGTRASGVLWKGLKGQDEKVLLPIVEDTDNALLAPMKYMLKLVQKHYSVPRLVKVSGRNKSTVQIFLTGTELRDNTDVRVKAGVEMFSQREEKKGIVDAMIQKGYIQEPRKAFELLDYKGLEEFMEDEYVDERKAERENWQMEEGKTPKVHPDDNHNVEYNIHNNQRKREEYSLWSKKAQDTLEEHIDGHRIEIQKSIEKIQGAAQGGPAAEGPPQEGGREGMLEDILNQAL